jgi:hypothetical protein
MRGERWALRAGEYLVSLACRRLPAGIRQERQQEWLAELPVILRDRGPGPVRVARMLAFAADTLRGTVLRGSALAPETYRGTHRGAHHGVTAKDIHWLGTGLLLLGGLLACMFFLLDIEAVLIYQLATGPGLAFSVTFTLVNLVALAASYIPRWYAAAERRWYSISKVVAGTGLSLRAFAGSSGWGHPLLFAIISYGGYAISVACLGMVVVLAVRSVTRPQHAE